MVDIAIHLGGRMGVEQDSGVDQNRDFIGEIGFERDGKRGYRTLYGGIRVEDLQTEPLEELTIASPVSKRPGQRFDSETGHSIPLRS